MFTEVSNKIVKKPILITGSHRSGSTWVGKMIAQSPSVTYIHEPFNIAHPPGVGICNAKFSHWFTYITAENEALFYKPIRKTVNFSYNLIDELIAKGKKNPKEGLSVLAEYKKSIQYRFSQVRPLIKDPIALFSSEWLASRFNTDIIVLIRHPAAFASSLKLQNWTFPFSHFLEQPLLMRDHLYEFEAEISAYAAKEHEIIDQATLLWKIIHSMILKYQQKHKDWVFVRHEDISLDPLSQFQHIFNYLNLNFYSDIQKTIQDYSSPKNPSEGKLNVVHSLRRDSKSNIRNWQKRLSESEIERIRNNVEYISSKFYSDQDWE